MTSDQPTTPSLSRGFVFAACGEGYTPIAVAGAQSLREMCGDAQIDLFTDTPPTGPHPFDKIHPLEKSTHRPKFEALLRSRFDLTVYLDSDMIFLADITDIFEVLARNDMMAAHFETRASSLATTYLTQEIPAAFPQINGGLLGVRRSPETTTLLTDLRDYLIANAGMDQVPMREALYNSDLKLAILPVEYNMMRLWVLKSHRRVQGAPRILHLRRLQKHLRKGGGKQIPNDVAAAVTPLNRARLQILLDTDPTLADKKKRTVATGLLKDLVKFFKLV